MIKVEIDPITKKVLSYTKVQSNTQVYTSDMVFEEKDLPENLNIPYIYENGTFSKLTEENCDKSVENLCNKISGIAKESDIDYFLRLLMDGYSLEDAKIAVLNRSSELDLCKKERESLIEEHQKSVNNIYIEENRKIDMSLNYLNYSAVVLVIKDENKYLNEWIEHHLNIGFDHIYIYDNGSKEKVIDVVSLLNKENKQKITVVDWRGHHDHIQQDAYNHFMNNFKSDTRWGLFIDSDEFLRFTDGYTNNVNKFLKNYEDYTEIWGYEVEYNANGLELYENKPVRERFTKKTDVREGLYWKNFIQVNRIDSFLMHYAYYDPYKHQIFKNEQCNQNLFVIDHYYTKSWEEWNWKIRERGGADPKYHKALREFFEYNPDMKYLDNGENVIQKYE